MLHHGWLVHGLGPRTLAGGYMYGDFCSGDVWVTKDAGNGVLEIEHVLDTDNLLVGFGRGLNDELLLFTWGGTVFELDIYTQSN